MFRPFMWPSSKRFVLGFDLTCSDRTDIHERTVRSASFKPNITKKKNNNNNNYHHHHRRRRRYRYHYHRHRPYGFIRRYALRICVGQKTILTLSWFSSVRSGGILKWNQEHLLRDYWCKVIFKYIYIYGLVYIHIYIYINWPIEPRELKQRR